MARAHLEHGLSGGRDQEGRRRGCKRRGPGEC